VLAYLAHYTHRVAISNSRLVALDERGVRFRYKDYRRNGRERFRTMTLAPHEFIRRFLLHVLPKGFHRIRHYGLLASATCKANIARAKELIAAPLPSIYPSTEHDDADVAAGAAADHRPPCPCCGGRMIIVESFGRSGAPRPAVARSRRQNRDAMTPVTASSHLLPAGEPRFRRRIAVAPPSRKARATSSIRPKLPPQPLPRRQTRHRDRRSAANYASQRTRYPSRRPVKSP
jgi:hypothetical protein